MADIVITIAAALAFGILAHEIRIPPLVGFLAAGFCLHLFGFTAFAGLQEISDLGVVLLLFTIGLKFDLRSLLQPEAHGTALLHMVTVVLLGAGTIGFATVIGVVSVGGDFGTLALLGFALSFSSTVLVVKVLEDRSDDGSYYGQIAIAILVLQDLAAVAFITIAGEEPPSPWALALLLLIPAVWVLRRILDRIGRGELLVLFGVVMALGPGYVAFESVGIHGDLGALVLGLLFSTHPRAVEMSKSLFSVKELFLVGFFVVIGLQAVPTWSDLIMAFLLCAVLLPFNFVSFFLMGRLFGLRNRTSVRTSLALSNFSEFALIVVAVGIDSGLFDGDWLTITALAVALGMIISSLANAYSLQIVAKLDEVLPDENESRLRRNDRPLDTGTAEVVVLGMGRIGRGAYERFVERGDSDVIGIDNDHLVIEALREDGFTVLEGDATDHEFWHRLVVGGTAHTVVLAMALHDSNTFALEQLRIADFPGTIAAVVQRPDQADHFIKAGVHAVINIYSGSGAAVADAAIDCHGR
ncbi:cation:proton antiporter family protein [Brevibacterium oceani]|uniref:cation:proton antiporter family protein n=1 Tax=Brevibacterium oceani TaxID=358099 RepID=UPI0015E74A2D|nr:cation:proton antiporter family protein [Brevibacterium oceani]